LDQTNIELKMMQTTGDDIMTQVLGLFLLFKFVSQSLSHRIY